MKRDRRSFLKLLGSVPVVVVANAACQSGGASERAPDASPPSEPGRKQAALASPDDAGSCAPTGEDILGPFHLKDAPSRTVLADKSEPGARIKISGTVVGQDCKPLPGALLDVWHADETGAYDMGSEKYRLRGQMVTDAAGAYEFETILPGNYPLGDSMRPKHIHFIVSAPGFVPVTTQLYFAGDPYLQPNDPCGQCASGDLTHIVELSERDGMRHGVFRVVLARG